MGLGAALTEQRQVTNVLADGAMAATMALLIGLTGVTIGGAIRLLVGATPGSVNDPLRKVARRLAPHRRAVTAALAIAAAASAASPLLFSAIDDRALMASIVLAFLAVRARHLTWFAGIRHASDGRVRFAAARQLADGHVAFAGALLLLLGFVFTLELRTWAAIPVTLLAPGWFAWALPLRYVTVGRDGVLVSRWRERFYPFDGETTADAHADGMVVIPAGARRGLALRFAAISSAEGMFLAERIRERVYPEAGADTPETRSRAQLEASLASLEAAGGYRVAQVPREALWRIVEAPQVRPRVRLRAAELVAQEAAEDDRLRLQAVADDLAEPGTAAALSRLARP